MKTAVSLPDDLFAAAEAAASSLGISRSDLYRRALAAYLQRLGEQTITDALDRVHGGGGETVDPVLSWLQGASLAADADPGEGSW